MRTQLIAKALTRVDAALVTDEQSTIVVDLDDPERPLDHGGAPVDIGSHRILLAVTDGRAGVVSKLVCALREPATGAAHEQVVEAIEQLAISSVVAMLLIVGRTAYVASVGSAHAYLLRDDRVRDLVPAPAAAAVATYELCRGDRFVLCGGELEAGLAPAASVADTCMRVLESGSRRASAIVAEVDGDTLLRPHQLVPCAVLFRR